MDNIRRLLACTFAVAVTSVLTAQTIDIQQIVDGSKLPHYYLPAQWPTDLKAMKLALVGEFNPFLGAQTGMYFGEDSERANAEKQVAVFSEALSASWTKGEKVTIEGDDFLVTYRLNVPFAAAVDSGSFRRWKRNNQFALQLSLIRMNTIAKLEPLSIRLAEVRESLEAIESMIHSDSAVPAGGGAPFISGTQDALLYSLPVLSRAIRDYTRHFDGLFPRAANILELKTKVRPYLTSDQLDHWKTHNPNGGEFSYNSTLGGLLANEIVNPWKVPMLYENKAWPDGNRAVLFVDGQCKLLSEEEWTATQKFMKATTSTK